MRRIALLAIAVGIIGSFCATSTGTALAQSYISGAIGDDGNGCQIFAPCLTLSGALAKTSAGGAIVCMDTPAASLANGNLTITKSITIDCTGVVATAYHFNTAIIINLAAGDPLQTVRLRGITINGLGQGLRGISVLAARAVILEDLEITGETQQGIADIRTTGGLLLIKNSLIAMNAGAGIAIAATGGPYGATLENVRSFKNSFGLAVGSGNNIMVTKSILSGNSVAGLEMDAGAQVTLDSSVVNFNPTGLQSSGLLTLMGSTISYNNTAIIGASSSFGDNKIYGNGSPGTAPIVGAASTDHSKQ